MNVRKFKFLRRKSLIGKILRYPFKLIPSGAVMRILSGPLRGKRWIKGSHNLSVLLGTYERLQSNEFYHSTREVSVFWDLGAHVGYYSLLFRKGNPTGEIIAFEPIEINVEFFNKHMQLNQVTGFSLKEVAVSNQKGQLRFTRGATSVAGRITQDGERSAEVIRLSEWVSEGKVKIPQLIKMDIEGEEYKVLQDIESVLSNYKPKIFLSTHGKEIHQSCLTLLRSFNYSFKPLDGPDLENCREILAF